MAGLLRKRGGLHSAPAAAAASAPVRPPAARTRVPCPSWLEPAGQEAGARRPLRAAAPRRRLFRSRRGRAARGQRLSWATGRRRAHAAEPTGTPHGRLWGLRMGGGGAGRSDYCQYAKAEATGGEGAGCRRGQGALTSPARHSRGSRLHVPRAAPARSTSLRSARARPRARRPRSLLCSRPRKAHFDGLGSGPPAANHSRRFSLLPPPRSPRRDRPFPCPRGLGLQPAASPALGALARVAAFPDLRGVDVASSPCASGRSRVSAPRSLRSWAKPGPVPGAQSAPPSAFSTSRPTPAAASGREMVVLSVPAEVTVILLDIEGTTTPVAFVKVRGGRERGSYLCLGAKPFFHDRRPCKRSTRGRRGGVALYPL